jgi:hypothetical protein
MNFLKIVTSFLLITAMLFATGCSGYADFENKVRNDKGDRDETSPPITMPEDKSKSFNVGDTILWEQEKRDFQGNSLGFEQMEYTVNSVKAYNSLEEANLSLSDMDMSGWGEIPDVDIPELEKPFSENGSLTGSNKLILIDVTIKNINVVNDSGDVAEDDMNITELRLECSDEKAINMMNREMVYFSAHGDVGKYNHYNLPVGETKSVKIAWIAGSNLIDFSKIFLCVGGGSMPEYRKYVDLKLS